MNFLVVWANIAIQNTCQVLSYKDAKNLNCLREDVLHKTNCFNDLLMSHILSDY